MKQLNGFSASKYQPEQWVNLIKESGAKYAVITTKHHDGVSLEFKGRKAITSRKIHWQKRCLKSFCFCIKKSGLKTGFISHFQIGAILITISIPGQKSVTN
jgi:alpha-L-fucosidase